MGLYDKWKKRAYIRITNFVATASFQHKMTLTWLPGMRNDFRDIRFTMLSGRKCSHWIESYTSRTSAVVWVNIPEANTRAIYLFYANNSVASGSSGVDTFDFFDDFVGSAIDATKWTTTGTPVVANSECTLNRSGGVDTGINSIPTCADGTCLRIKLKTAHWNASTYTEVVSATPSDWNNGIWWYAAAATGGWQTKERTANGGTNSDAVTSGWSAAAYHILDLVRAASSVYWIIDGTNQTALTTGRYTGTTAFGMSAASANGSEIVVDWILKRKHAATMPTLTVIWHGSNAKMKGILAYIGGIPSEGTEHVFDPVNIDHGMVAGVGPQEIEMGAVNVNHGMVPGLGIVEVEMGPVNIYHPMYPSAKMQEVIEPVTGNADSMISVSVHQGTDDVMMQADFEYDGPDIGNYYSGDYLRRIVVKMPDYLGTVHTVFVGICPSSTAHYEPAKDKMVMRAFDYGLYLTSNPLETKDLSLLPPDNQTSEGANVAKVLHYRNATHTFQIGQRVIGDISAASGEIVELVQGDSFRRMTLYPATGKFVDGENLSVGGVTYAIADGRSVDTSYTPFYATRTPADWFKSILGGDNWMNVTGIRPKKIVSCGWSSTSDPPAVPMVFGSLDSRMDAAKEFAAYLGYIVLVKLGDWGSGLYGPDFYAVPIASIDDSTDGLDLPSPLTITSPDAFLDGSIELEQNGEAQYDRIWIRCRDLNGVWMEAIRTNSRVDNGEGPYRTLLLEPENIATRTDMNDYADLMYDLHVGRACTWTAIFYDRPDLQLYQRVIFSGYGIKIPNGTYRIIHIKKDYGCTINKTTCLLMLATDWDNRMKSTRTPSDSIKEVERIAKKLIETEAPPLELATCTANDGHTVTYLTDEGATGQGLDSTATPTADGVIGVGSRISINHARGGVVCIPIVASSGSSTDLLIVDVPIITQIAVDPLDANYWFLSWTPGANNQTVSVNYQTTSYPAAPGTVVDHGSPASCRTMKLAVGTTRLRIRFSGPLATYYVKLWGERNGTYSATGATGTITSGSSVTVADPEEPEPIEVIDLQLTAQWEVISDYVPNTREVYNHVLPFPYNGSDNIYIGGPVDWNESDDSEDMWWPDQPTDRYFWCDDQMKITGPKGSTTIYGAGWHAPVNISGLLNAGVNVIKIETTDTIFGATGNSALYVRSYYL